MLTPSPTRANMPRLALVSMASCVLLLALGVLEQSHAVEPSSRVGFRNGRAVGELARRAGDVDVHSDLKEEATQRTTWSYLYPALAQDRAAGLATTRVSQTFPQCEQKCKQLGGSHASCADAATSSCKCDNGYIQSNPDPHAMMSVCIPVTQSLCDGFCEVRYSSMHTCTDPQTLTCSCPTGYVPIMNDSNGFQIGCTPATAESCTAWCQNKWSAGVHGICADDKMDSCRCAEGYIWSEPAAQYMTECIPVTQSLCDELCKVRLSSMHTCTDPQTLTCSCPSGYVSTINESNGADNGCTPATAESCTARCQNKWFAGAHGICADDKTGGCQCAEGYTWSKPAEEYITECVPVTEELCTESCQHFVSPQHICADPMAATCVCPEGYTDTLDESTGKVNGCTKVSTGTSDSGTDQAQGSNQALQVPADLTIKQPPKTRRR